MLLGLFLIFLIIQIFQPVRNIDYGQVPASDISLVYKMPENVQSIFKISCYDCHSNSTDYPAYSYIQPLAFYLENHIRKGKEELNFSEWANYSERKRNNKLEAIVDQIKQKKMPMPSYTYIHRDAKLSEKQAEEVFNWIKSVQPEN